MLKLLQLQVMHHIAGSWSCQLFASDQDYGARLHI